MKGNSVGSNRASLINRLIKNQKKLKTYLVKNGIEAYRLYNKDIPEYPYLIDIYGNKAVIYEQGKKLEEEEAQTRLIHQKDIEDVIKEVLAISPELQFFKLREKQKRNEQYRALDPSSNDFFVIQEGRFKFLVNVQRYLDTGLFLDHRPLRQFLLQNSEGKKVLNLFSYTGSLSVAAALGGGTVTTIDMSNTYLQWAYENFLLNKIDPNNHIFYQADVLKEIKIREEKNERYDIILLDPPSFSNSKRMEEDLDIERDHPILIRDCMNLLAQQGTLYFSTNKRKFQLHPIISQHYRVKEISHWTIPLDFHHSEIHRAFTINRV
jgi:23S rRNA (cytosine1962-C5)-methyltransferase